MPQSCFCLCLLVLAAGAVGGSRPGEPSSFFLKAPKSVPRAGRSAPGDFESFFLKASKSVPRVGRRNGGSVDSPDSPYEQWLNNEYLASLPSQSSQYYENLVNGDSISSNYQDNEMRNSLPVNPELDSNFYEYLAMFPTHFDKDSLAHRRRPSYDFSPQNGRQTDGQDGGRQLQENLNKELDEARYQAIV